MVEYTSIYNRQKPAKQNYIYLQTNIPSLLMAAKHL